MKYEVDLEKVGVAVLAPRMCVLGHDPCGGSEVVLWQDAKLIAEAGVPVRVYARAACDGALVKVIPTRTNARLLTSLEYCGQFLWQEKSAAVISCNEPTVAGLAPERAIVRFEWTTPLPRYWNVPGLLGRFQRAFYLFPCGDEKKLFQEAHPAIPHSSQFVRHYGIDLQLFKPMNGCGERPLRVGFAGQWVERKGVMTLLKAWETVKKRLPMAELHLLDGRGLWKTTGNAPPGVEEIIKKGEEMESRGMLHIRPAIPRSQMPAFWNSLSLAVVPSLYEPLASVVLEAMACGIPVLASDVGGLPEMVVHGESGLLLPPNDASALAEALLRVLTKDDLRNRMAAGARHRAETFSFERRTRDLLALLQQKMNPSTGRMPAH